MIGWLLLAVLLVLTVLCIAGRIGSGTWVNKLMMAIDIMLCTLIWGGYGICISSRCCGYLRQEHGPAFWRGLGHVLNLKKGHCEWALTHDLARNEASVAWIKSLPPAKIIPTLSPTS